MSKKLKPIPKFKNEKEERDFWQNVDSTEYVDYSDMSNWKLPNLKLTTKPITIRLPKTLIEKIKIKANQIDMPYQSLIKEVLFRAFVKPSTT